MGKANVSGRLRAAFAAALFAALAGAAGAQQKDAYLAYVYPAGGQAGTTFRVTVAGQFLKGADMAIVSGNGMRASVADYVGASGPLSYVQEEALKQRIDALIKAKSAPQASAPRGYAFQVDNTCVEKAYEAAAAAAVPFAHSSANRCASCGYPAQCVCRYDACRLGPANPSVAMCAPLVCFFDPMRTAP